MRDKIIRTLRIIAEEVSEIEDNENIQNYDFTTIRRFLIVSNFNPQIAAKKIISDIQWKK